MSNEQSSLSSIRYFNPGLSPYSIFFAASAARSEETRARIRARSIAEAEKQKRIANQSNIR
jgi:hypothetical protein